jgi:hypothetical protein
MTAAILGLPRSHRQARNSPNFSIASAIGRISFPARLNFGTIEKRE